MLEVALGENERFGRLHVDLAAFCDFDAWIDLQTEQLTHRWIHLAAPAAARCRRAVSDL
jgi:hypothetical protein